MKRTLDEVEFYVLRNRKRTAVVGAGCALIMMAYLILPLVWLLKLIFS